MLGSIRDITTVIVAALLMFVIMLVFFIVTLDGAELTSSNFNQGILEYKACTDDYDQKYTQYAQYNDQDVLMMDVDTLAEMRLEIETETSCNSDFVTSNTKQLSVYAENVYNEINDDSDIHYGLIDTIYTAPANYYAYLGIPQEYLFFAMSDDQSKLMGYIYAPTVDGYTLRELWSEDQSSDLDEVQSYTSNLLVKYYEKVI